MPMPEPTWLTLLPPLLAIGLAIGTRQVYLSLAAGVWLGWTMLSGWNPIAGLGATIEALVMVLGDAGNARVVLFTLIIGALIATVEAAGGVSGFVSALENRRLVTSARGSRMLAYIVGAVIFVESNITVLVSGAVARPLFDRFKSSREMLAYLIDSTSSAVCILVPLNAWGAYILVLLAESGVADPLGTLVGSIPLNLYALVTVVMAGGVAFTGLAIGPMRRAEARAAEGRATDERLAPLLDEAALVPPPEPGVTPRALTMILPIAVMVLTMPIGLFITGGGDFRAGSGSTSVLWAVLAGLLTAWILVLIRRELKVDRLITIGLRGAGGMLGMALVLMLALALGAVTRELGTGVYVAQAIGGALSPAVLVPLVFLTGAVISFSTGTSWGTFAILVPIVVPVAAVLGLPIPLLLAAALSGGIFGDHSSPISDTTIVSSLAAATDHVAHVRTQLPYAGAAATVAIIGFALLGALA